MKLPEGWESFYEDVCNKIRALTATGVWTIEASTIFAWLGNFEKDEHRYIAAHILDRMTFRSEKMLEGAYKQFIASTFRERAQEKLRVAIENVENWMRALRNDPRQELNNIVICSVSKAGEHGESGSHIIRILTGDLFHENRVFSVDVEKLDSLENKLILIVDDFVGSGEQFDGFSEQSGLREAAKKNWIIYAPAVAYCKGIEQIFDKKYGIEIFPLEVIPESEQFFSHAEGDKFFGDDINCESEVLKCYHEMRQLDSTFAKGAWLGRKKASLCVAFQWGCPNQSLGVMWYRGTNGWRRLVRRRGAQ